MLPRTTEPTAAEPRTGRPPRKGRLPRPDVDVTAVLVAHDGAVWLPEVLAALDAQTCRPRQVVCVDTGSVDDSAALMTQAYGDVVALPDDTGYGAAVAAGLAAASASTRWVWLLHDDCAPDPGALEALLGHADASPSSALLGPKVRDWADPRILVEVGITTDTAGHRETGLERRERDQGQHDAVRDVLAVGTAGALVRRDVWDRVGGLDPALPVFRDDLDLGWRVNAGGDGVVVVPAATVRHVRAATTGRRRLDAAPGRPEGVDRRHALWVLAAHAPASRLPLLLLRLALATVLRVLGFVLTRRLGAAGDELAAYGGLLAAPARLHRARKARAATRTVPTRALRGLFASRAGRARARAQAIGDWLSGGGVSAGDPLGALGGVGPDSDDAVDLRTGGSGALRRVLVRPGVLLGLGLLLVALVAERSVLSTGGGLLAGGRLLPPGGGARDLWQAYVGSRHDVGTGSSAPAPPALALLALLSTVLLGKVWLAVDVIVLGSVPLAGISAYLASGRLVRHRALRLWAAATWALLPVATGAVAAGRLDAAAVQVGLPALALGIGRLLALDPRATGWRRAWAVGLGTSGLAAFAPLVGVLAATVLVLGGVVGLVRPAGDLDAARRRLRTALVAAAVPFVVLLPWSATALTSPGLLLAGVGRTAADPALVDADRPAWALPLLWPGGAGTPAAWLTVGLLLAALAGTVRLARRGLALGAWAVALGALLLALVMTHLEPLAYGGAAHLPLWPGVPLQVAAVGMLAAALVAADGVRTRLADSDFGARQLTAGLLVVAAAVVPVLLAASWVLRGADDPLVRGRPAVLPAFAQADLEAARGGRALLLTPRRDGTVAYTLTGASRPGLGAADLPPARTQDAQLSVVVADLLTPSGTGAAVALATRSVRWVALPPGPDSEALAGVLDTQPGLSRRAGSGPPLWQVAAPTARLSVLPPAPAAVALTGAPQADPDVLRAAPATALASGREAARTPVEPGPEGRLLVLADARDRGWRATLDGRPLPRRTAWGWAQAFALPPAGGTVEVRFDQGPRHRALLVQLLLVGVVAVLAGPGTRRVRGLEPDDEDEPAHVPADAPVGARA
jgi:GT2 family glycosyltransferase